VQQHVQCSWLEGASAGTARTGFGEPDARTETVVANRAAAIARPSELDANPKIAALVIHVEQEAVLVVVDVPVAVTEVRREGLVEFLLDAGEPLPGTVRAAPEKN